MKCLYIYNALSGSNKEKRNHNIIINRLKKIYSSLECFEITKEKNEIDKILEYNFDDIIISGGDGSFSLFINHLSNINFEGCIGYIPTGTANDFARNNSIPLDIDKSLDLIENRQYEEVSFAKVNDRYFTYALALGKISNVGYKTKQENKKLFKKFSYILSGLKELFSNKLYDIKIKSNKFEKVFKTPLILVLNTNYLGGFKVNKNTREKYDIIVLKKGWFIGIFSIIKIFLFGYKKKETKGYHYYKFSSFEISSFDNKKWCVDGEEYLSSHLIIQGDCKQYKMYKKKD